MEIIDVHKRVYVGDKLICGYEPQQFGDVILDYDTSDGANHKETNYTLGVKKFSSFIGPRNLTKINHIDTSYLTKFTCEGCAELQNIDITLFRVKNASRMFYRDESLSSARIRGVFDEITSMFNGCTNLQTADVIFDYGDRINEASGGLFYGCAKLEKAPAIFVNENRLGAIFHGCNSLKEFTFLGDPIRTVIGSGFRGIPETGVAKYDSRYDYSNLFETLPSGWTREEIVVSYVKLSDLRPQPFKTNIEYLVNNTRWNLNIEPNETSGAFETILYDANLPITSINIGNLNNFSGSMLTSSNPIQLKSIYGGYYIISVDLTGLDLTNLTSFDFKYSQNLKTVKGLKNARPTNLQYAFQNCEHLEEVDAINLDNCNNVAFMFQNDSMLSKITLIGNPAKTLRSCNGMFDRIPPRGEIKYDNRYENDYNTLFRNTRLPRNWTKTPIDVTTLP